MRSDGLLENARAVGEHLVTAIVGMSNSQILEVRGQGLLLGIQLASEIAPAVVRAGLERGIILNAANPTTIRLAPPLILEEADADLFVAALPGLLEAANSTENKEN